MCPSLGTFATVTFLRRLHQTGRYRVFNTQQAGWPAILLILCLSVLNYDYATTLQQDNIKTSEGRIAAVLPLCEQMGVSLKSEKFALEYNGLIQLKLVIKQDPEALLLPDIIITTSLHSNVQ